MVLKYDDRGILVKVLRSGGGDSSIPNIEFGLQLFDKLDEVIELGDLDSGSYVEGFFKCLELLEIQITEANCAEIVEIFDFMQPTRQLLRNFDDLHFRNGGDFVDRENQKVGRVEVPGEPRIAIFVRKGKEDIARKCRDIIRPPHFSVEGGVRQIRFWMVDRVPGNLERWEISENNEGKRKVEGEVLERDIVSSREVDQNK